MFTLQAEWSGVKVGTMIQLVKHVDCLFWRFHFPAEEKRLSDQNKFEAAIVDGFIACNLRKYRKCLTKLNKKQATLCPN